MEIILEQYYDVKTRYIKKERQKTKSSINYMLINAGGSLNDVDLVSVLMIALKRFKLSIKDLVRG